MHYITGSVKYKNGNFLLVELKEGTCYKLLVSNTNRYEVGLFRSIYVQKIVVNSSSASQFVEEFYGFTCEEEKDLFNDLLTIRGIGIKTAMNILKNGWERIFSSINNDSIDEFEQATTLKKGFCDFVFNEIKVLVITRYLKRIDKIVLKQARAMQFNDLTIFKVLSKSQDLSQITVESIIERMNSV